MKSYFTFILAVLFSFTSFAQRGTLQGKVVEVLKDGKEQAMPFVNIYIYGEKDTLGASSDFNGNFTNNLKVGNYTIISSYIGYRNDTIKNVRIEKAQTKSITLKMGESSTDLDVVEITVERKTNTDAAVIKEARESKQVVSAISSETIEKSQDSDASEVVKRIPGVTVTDNNYIMIRGLNERYNHVMLHDVFAPSMESDVKSFAFDIIPSNLIDRILIYKSPAAELPSEFTGGMVKVYTKSIPSKTATKVSFSTTFREGSSFEDFKQSERTALHSTGFNDGFNNLPANFPSSVGDVQEDLDLINAAGRSLKNNWLPETVNSNVDKSFAVTHANVKKFENGRTFGSISAVSYNNSRTIFDVDRADYNAYDFTNNRSVYIYEFDDKQYNHKIRSAFLQNFAYRLNSNNIIEFKNLFTAFSKTQYTNRTGEDFEFGYLADNHSFDQVYRGIYSGQLKGQHLANEKRTKFEWTAAYGYSYRDQPDYKRYRSDVSVDDPNDKTIFVGVPISPNFLGRFYSEMEEHIYTTNLNLEHKFSDKSSYQPTLRTGVFIEDKRRTFNARNLGFVRASSANFDQNLIFLSIDELFNEENINTTTGIGIREDSNPSDSYTASNFLFAFYAGGDFPIIKKLLLNTGIRMEDNRQLLNSATINGIPVEVDNPILTFLPSFNLTYDYSEKTKLRASYGQTLNRPEFRELAPFSFYDFNFNLVNKGSDSLLTPIIHNFDLKWEMYPNPTEIISIAAFYKRFNNPIETLFVPGGGSGGIKTFTFGNAAYALSYGVELELRKSLLNLTNSKIIDDISVLLNTSIIQSEVTLGRAQLGQSNERPLQGQSPYIVNAGLFYQNDDNGWQANVMYNVIGKRIFIIGFDVYPDIYELPRNHIDINIAKRIKERWEIKFGIGDLLNQSYALAQDANESGKIRRDTDQIIQNYRPGRTYSLGMSYAF